MQILLNEKDDIIKLQAKEIEKLVIKLYNKDVQINNLALSTLEYDDVLKGLQNLSIRKNNKKYKLIKQGFENHEWKNYKLYDIINIVNSIIVIQDLTFPLSNIKQMLQSNINKNCGVYMFFNKETNDYYIGSKYNTQNIKLFN